MSSLSFVVYVELARMSFVHVNPNLRFYNSCLCLPPSHVNASIIAIVASGLISRTWHVRTRADARDHAHAGVNVVVVARKSSE